MVALTATLLAPPAVGPDGLTIMIGASARQESSFRGHLPGSWRNPRVPSNTRQFPQKATLAISGPYASSRPTPSAALRLSLHTRNNNNNNTVLLPHAPLPPRVWRASIMQLKFFTHNLKRSPTGFCTVADRGHTHGEYRPLTLPHLVRKVVISAHGCMDGARSATPGDVQQLGAREEVHHPTLRPRRLPALLVPPFWRRVAMRRPPDGAAQSVQAAPNPRRPTELRSCVSSSCCAVARRANVRSRQSCLSWRSTARGAPLSYLFAVTPGDHVH